MISGRAARVIGPLLLVAAAGAAGARLFTIHSAPAEDAAMLIRYVGHIASGHGVVWNIGDAPVDGATDLLPAVLAAGVAATGVDPERSVRLLALAAHVCTVFIIASLVPSRGIGLLLAGIVLFGPGWAIVNAGFVTPVFALFAVMAAVAAYKGRFHAFVFAASALIITRPEGVFLAALIGLPALVVNGWPRGRVPVGAIIAGGASLAAYALWRRWYFGDWIPSPYYAKGGFHFYHYGVISSVNYVMRFLWFALLPAAIAWRRGGAARQSVLFAAVPVAGFTVVWMMMSAATNFAGRFQYAVLPVTVAVLAAAWPAWWPSTARARAATVSVLAIALVANLAQYVPVSIEDGRRDVGYALKPYALVSSEGSGPARRTMAVTEAGLVPLYSQWRTVDTLGLNDADIARHRIDATRLERERPDVLLVHRSFPMDPRPTAEARVEVTTNAVVVLLDYAQAHGFVLARRWGATPGSTHAYFVRPDAPEAAALVEAIRAAPYACLAPGPAEAGLRGSLRRLINAIRGATEPSPRCVDWSE